MLESGRVEGMSCQIKDTSGSVHGRRMRSKIMKYFVDDLGIFNGGESPGFSESELSEALCKTWESRHRNSRETATQRKARKLKARYADRPNTTLACLFLVCAVSALVSLLCSFLVCAVSSLCFFSLLARARTKQLFAMTT